MLTATTHSSLSSCDRCPTGSWSTRRRCSNGRGGRAAADGKAPGRRRGGMDVLVGSARSQVFDGEMLPSMGSTSPHTTWSSSRAATFRGLHGSGDRASSPPTAQAGHVASRLRARGPTVHAGPSTRTPPRPPGLIQLCTRECFLLSVLHGKRVGRIRSRHRRNTWGTRRPSTARSSPISPVPQTQATNHPRHTGRTTSHSATDEVARRRTDGGRS